MHKGYRKYQFSIEVLFLAALLFAGAVADTGHKAQLALDGIRLGTTEQAVRSEKGQPDATRRNLKGLGYRLRFANGKDSLHYEETMVIIERGLVVGVLGEKLALGPTILGSKGDKSEGIVMRINEVLGQPTSRHGPSSFTPHDIVTTWQIAEFQLDLISVEGVVSGFQIVSATIQERVENR